MEHHLFVSRLKFQLFITHKGKAGLLLQATLKIWDLLTKEHELLDNKSIRYQFAIFAGCDNDTLLSGMAPAKVTYRHYATWQPGARVTVINLVLNC